MAAPEETAQRMLAAFQKLNDRTIDLQREIQGLTWERDTANRQLADAVAVAVAKLAERDREIEVLTQERDNALLRVEELERSFGLNDPYGEYRGGVHPNA